VSRVEENEDIVEYDLKVFKTINQYSESKQTLVRKLKSNYEFR